MVTNRANEVHQGTILCWTVGETPGLGSLGGARDIDGADLTQLPAHYGMTEGITYEEGDLDGDVDLADLAALPGVYGAARE